MLNITVFTLILECDTMITQSALNYYIGEHIIMNIGEKIKELRTEQKMTQEKLANYLNVTVSAVSQWEAGKTMPDVTMIVPICNLFSISADKLLNIRVAEKGTIISEVKNKAFEFAEKGEYDKAIAIVKEKMQEFPNEPEFIAIFAQLVMDFDKRAEERIEDKEDLCQELYILVMEQKALENWKNSPNYDQDLDKEILGFLCRAIITRNVLNNSRQLRKEVEGLMNADFTPTIKSKLTKIVEEQDEIGDAANRLIGYEVIIYLMKTGLEEYKKTHDKALLDEVIANGENFLQKNSSLRFYFDCLRYLISATEEKGESAEKYLDLVKSVKKDIAGLVG